MGTLEKKNTYENAYFQPPKLLWPSQITQWDATRPYWQNVIVTNSKEMLPTSLMIFSRLVHSKKVCKANMSIMTLSVIVTFFH